MAKRKVYNPNSYNALDAAIAFLILLTVFFVIKQTLSPALRGIRDNDYYLFLCVDAFITQGVSIGVAFAFSRIRNVSLFSGGGFVYKFDLVQILFAVMLTFGIYLLIGDAHMKFDDDLYHLFYDMGLNESTQASISQENVNVPLALLYIYVLSPILPCICEEVYFRGIVMRGLRQYGALFSIIVSAFCFALMHGSFSQLILQFVFGLAVAAVVTLTGNFLLGAAMHFANNLFVYLFNLIVLNMDLNFHMGAEFTEAMQVIFGVVCLVVSGAYFINLAIVKAKRSALKKPEEIPIKEAGYYAKVKAKSETVWQVLYPAQVDFNLISNGEHLYEYDGKEVKVNKKSNKILSVTLLLAAITFSVIRLLLNI